MSLKTSHKTTTSSYRTVTPQEQVSTTSYRTVTPQEQVSTTTYRTLNLSPQQQVSTTLLSSGSVSPQNDYPYETVRYLVPVQQGMQQQQHHQNFVMMPQQMMQPMVQPMMQQVMQPMVQPMMQQVMQPMVQPMMQQMVRCVSPMYVQTLPRQQLLSVSSQESDLYLQQQTVELVRELLHEGQAISVGVSPESGQGGQWLARIRQLIKEGHVPDVCLVPVGISYDCLPKTNIQLRLIHLTRAIK